MEDRRQTGKVDTGMIAVLAIATLLLCTVQWWNLPFNQVLERLGLLHRAHPHAEPPHPPPQERNRMVGGTP